MNVLSLFDGMSCGQIALKELGIKVDKYYASEIDKFAIQQTQHNFPDTIQLGSVVDVDVSKLDRINLLIGGSPCQSFSFAGKRKGMSTTRNEEIYTLDRYLELKNDGFEFEGQSYLFWEYMRILTDIRKYNPDVKFLLENVEMGNKWERVLSEAIGVFGVHINSALVSAQNRKRIYWTNIRIKEVGLFGEVHSDIPQPEDRGILLRDILEEDVDEKYYLSDALIKRMLNPHKSFTPKINPDKTGCLTTGNNSSKMSFDNGATFVSTNGKAPTQRSATGGNHSDMDLIYQRPRGNNKGGYFEDKTPTLSANSWEQNNLVIQLNQSTESGGKQPYQQNIVYADYGKMTCLDTGSGRRSVYTESRIRRLTPTECARLQTIPSWYTWIVSETQQYKMLGNGWTIEVIKHLMKHGNFETKKHNVLAHENN